MRPIRFTIANLSVLIVICAFLFAALRYPTEPWSTGAFTLALLVLGVAVLGAVLRRGNARAYWGGFAILGWGYMILVFGPWCDTHIAPLLITRVVFERMHGEFAGPGAYVRQIGFSLVMYGYQQMGHSLTAVLLGMFGGAIARWFATAPCAEEEAPSSAPAGTEHLGDARARLAGDPTVLLSEGSAAHLAQSGTANPR